MDQAKQLQDELRDSKRRLLVRIPGCFINPEVDESVFCEIVNVSENGLGVVSQKKLPQNSTLHLITLDDIIPFSVVWCHETDQANHYSCGLITSNSSKNLLTLFNIITTSSD